MQIGDQALVSIKEFSDYTGVAQSVLRYYDDINLFHPVVRGENNYRYYSLPQIQTIKLIETLRGLKVPLRQIGDIIEKRDEASMISLLTKYEAQLNSELRRLQQSFSIVHTLRALAQSDLPNDEHEIIIKYRDRTAMVLGPHTDFTPGEKYHRPYSNFYRIAHELGVNPSYPIGGFFTSFEAYLKTPGQPEHFFSLDPDGTDYIDGGNYLVGYARGGYGEKTDLPERIAKYVDEHEVKLAGPVYQVYPLNEITVKDPHNYLLRVSLLVES
jgi:DNA-binding transcriptional MerR regulator